MKKRFYLILVLIVLIAIGGFSAIWKKRVSPKDVGNPSLLSLYNHAKDVESKGAYLEARTVYMEVFKKTQDEELARRVQEGLEEVNMKILFSPIITEESILYTVKEGDTLNRIAKGFNTTVELIMKSNNLSSDLIRIGEKLKVSVAKYSLVIDRSQNILTLKSNQDVLKTYKVSTGMNDSTPVGSFKIINKLKDPVWYKAGAVVPSGSPDNILGSRWIGISVAGYGIHGTIEPETIGKQITAGCIRMKEPDVQELYSILPIGTEVTIID